VAGLVVQEGQHGLVAAVHAIEVPDGQCAGRRDVRVVEAAKYLHRARDVVLTALAARATGVGRVFRSLKEVIL
jgi:predicted RNA-binding protein with PUA domain